MYIPAAYMPIYRVVLALKMWKVLVCISCTSHIRATDAAQSKVSFVLKKCIYINLFLY